MPRSLANSLITLAQFYMTVLLVVWIALFAPMICQYHGLMLYSHNYPLTADLQQNPSQNDYQHSAMPSITLVMDLLLAAMPSGSTLILPMFTQSRAVEWFRFPNQRREPPPRRPPRL